MSKEIQFIRKEGASRTPAVIVSELERYGKLEGMKTGKFRFYKYFSFDGRYYEATYLNDSGSVGEVVSIRKITKDQFNFLLPTRSGGYDYKIGGF